MSISAVRVGAAILNKMQAGGGAFRRQFVREIAGIPVCAFAFLQEVLADSNFRRVVGITASRPLRAGT